VSLPRFIALISERCEGGGAQMVVMAVVLGQRPPPQPHNHTALSCTLHYILPEEKQQGLNVAARRKTAIMPDFAWEQIFLTRQPAGT